MCFFRSIISMYNYGQECISQQNSYFGSCEEGVEVMESPPGGIFEMHPDKMCSLNL